MSGLRGGRLLAIVASVAMLAAVVAGWSVIGSPSHQRQLRLDGKRIASLTWLARQIESYVTAHKQLPPDLSMVYLSEGNGKDPNGIPFEYAITGPMTYRLCATFDTASDPAQDDGIGERDIYAGWAHPAGHYCFARSGKGGLSHE